MSGIGSIFPTWGGTVGPPNPRPDGGGTRSLPLAWKGLESPYGIPVPLAYGVTWVDGVQVYAGDTFTYWGDNYINEDSVIRRVTFIRNQETGVVSKVEKDTEAQSAVILLCENATDVLDILVNGVSVNTETLTTAQRLALICGKNKFTTLAEGVPPAGESVAYFHSGTGSATGHSRLSPPSTRTTATNTYSTVAHIATCALAIGWSEGRPKYQFKVQALLAQSATVGAHPADVALDLWKRAGKPEHLADNVTHTLDVETYYRAYVTSGGGSGSTDWRVSRAVEDQTSAADLLQSLLDETYCTAITLENGVVRIVPRDAGNTTAYALGVNDFVLSEGSDPVVIERKQASDCFNCFPVKYQVVTASGSHDVTNEDTTFAVANPSTSGISGILRAPAVNAQWISTAEHALNLSALLARESFTVRSTYKFSLHPRWVLLQVGDIVSLTEPHLGLSSKNARIVRLSEDGQGLISVEAQEWFGQVAYTTPAVDPFDGFGETLPGQPPGPGEDPAANDEALMKAMSDDGELSAADDKALFFEIVVRTCESYYVTPSPIPPELNKAMDAWGVYLGTIGFNILWYNIERSWSGPNPTQEALLAAWMAADTSVVAADFQFAFRVVRQAIDAAVRPVIATKTTAARTPADRFAEIGSALDHGAVGNGTADDTDAIQSAIDGGGMVRIPAGTYRITSPIQVPAGVCISGDGPENTIIFADGCDAFVYGVTVDPQVVFIRDLRIRGDKTGGTAGIRVPGVTSKSQYHTGLRVENVFLEDLEYGIYLRSARSVVIEKCQGFQCHFGIYAKGQVVLTRVANCDFVRNNSSGTGDSVGIYVGSAVDYTGGTEGRPEDFTIVGTRVFGYAFGVLENQCLMFQLVGSDIDYCTKFGVYVSGPDGNVVVRGNWVSVGGASAVGVYLSTQGTLTGTAKRVIDANHISSYDGASAYGIHVETNQQNLTITNNFTSGFVTNDIRLHESGSTVIRDNAFMSEDVGQAIYIITTLGSGGCATVVEDNRHHGMIWVHPSSNGIVKVLRNFGITQSTEVVGATTISSGTTSATTTFASLNGPPPDFISSATCYLLPTLIIESVDKNCGAVWGTASPTGVAIYCSTGPTGDATVRWRVRVSTTLT